MKRRVWIALALALTVLLAACAWASAETLPKSISIAGTRRVLGLGLSENAGNNVARVVAAFKPSAVQARYRVFSNRPQVAVAEQDAKGWYLRGIAPGSCTVTAVVQREMDGQWVDTAIRHRIAVTVKRAVKLASLSCATKKISLGLGETFDLNALTLKYKPAYADCVGDGGLRLKWSSGKPGVATVTDGVVKALSKGSSKLTGRAPDGSGKKVTIALTVREILPTDLTLSESAASLQIGDTLGLLHTLLPENASNPQVIWESEDARVASVDDKGLVTALAAGSARITCRSVAAPKLSASCLVRVASQPVSDSAYRVYTVGNARYYFYQELFSTLNDQKLIAGAFEHADGIQVESIVNRSDLTGAQIEALLKSMSHSGADEDDVSVFFYSGHGGYPSGALVGVDGEEVSVATVRNYLDQVPGTVILILDSCYSGRYATARAAVTPSAYNRQVIQAFASGATAKSNSGSGKYKVITACAADQESWCWDPDFGFFAYVAAKGMGCTWPKFASGALAADQDGNGQVLLSELYAYVAKTLPPMLREYGVEDAQDVQVWPQGDPTVVVARQ